MIETRYQQRRLAEGLFAEEVEGWWEAWMEKAEYLLGLLDVSFGPLPIAVCIAGTGLL